MKLESVAETVSYVDPRTGATYPIGTPRWRSETGGPLMLTALPGMSRSEIEIGRRSLWRYAASLPIHVAEPITMGEGCTPLIERSWHGKRAFLKLETTNPTGSFKDRGATVMLSTLRQQGIDHVLEDSSGNGGAAIAGYAAAGGMKSKILVPASTQPGKTVQMRAYGAETELTPARARTRQMRPSDRRTISSTPVTPGTHSSSRERRRSPMNSGRTSALGHPTTS